MDPVQTHNRNTEKDLKYQPTQLNTLNDWPNLLINITRCLTLQVAFLFHLGKYLAALYSGHSFLSMEDKNSEISSLDFHRENS